MKKSSVALIVVAVVLAIVASFFFYKAYDVKTNYYYSEYSTSATKNAYVGGDAYNYIINGNYFTGYLTVGSASALGTVILLCFGMYFYYRSKDTTMNGMKAIYDEIKKLTTPEVSANTIITETGGLQDEQSI